ncbi:MAG: tripartite tricarboxylate transporter substrate-binding protein [Ramlibacter sp.]|uniref:Bug family tripartite tricarboxylate transporter substrate binding protein n=1 Tax=Ramlibacter sp. TaxID=1917967 RepID=UPI002608CE78|nr:tripartite tricarboxylate transporter substrate-binding protein [Ramlibacter sp.]MDH4377051.1 tripartite tricarboxylate transporter substrate-binding protein [Ramlibacter sp.]
MNRTFHAWTRRALGTAALAALSLTAVGAHAQSWPARPVKLIVPAGAGAAPDVIARLLAERLSQTWGQGVVVDNRPGAGGIPGMSALARSANDGYTIGFVPAAMGTITPLVYKNPQFNPDTELTSAATIGISPLVMVANAASGINTLQDLARFAKANPGKANFAAPQPNSLPHLAGEMLNKAGSMGMTTVPYPAPPAALVGLMSGDVVMTTDGIPGLIGQIKAGKLKALAVTSTLRLPGLDIPTVAETYPGYEAIGWFQIILPAGTPTAVIDKVNADVNRIIMSPDMSARLNDMGVYPRADTPAAAREFFASQQRAMKKLVADLGIQPQ